MMATNSKNGLRLLFLTLLITGILGIIGLGAKLTENDQIPQFAILESKTLVDGKPLTKIRINVLNHAFSIALQNHKQLEVSVVNQTHTNKGLIAQTYQQSPYSLALSVLQDKNENRESSIDAGLMLTPTHHSLHIILTQLKRQ